MTNLSLGHLRLDMDDLGRCEEGLVWGTQIKELMICAYCLLIE